jgi:hypothetical protein
MGLDIRDPVLIKFFVFVKLVSGHCIEHTQLQRTDSWRACSRHHNGHCCSSVSALRSARHGCAITSPLHRSPATNAGGVAIYKQIRSPTICRPITIEIDNCMQCVREFGDVCLAEITIDSTVRFVLGSVYIYPCSSSRDIGMLLFQSLAPYIANNSAHPFLAVDADVRFGKNIQSVDFLKNTFNMHCATRATPGSTCLDLILTRNICVECLNYISHFSYHRPVLTRMVSRLSGLPSPNQDDRV